MSDGAAGFETRTTIIMLHNIDQTNYSLDTIWCGPGALNILTGVPLRECHELLTRIHSNGDGAETRTYEDLSGTWTEDMILALHELGYTAEPIDIIAMYPKLTHGPTLRRFLKERSGSMYLSKMLIVVNSHFVTSHFGVAADNWTKKPVPIDQFPQPTRNVKKAFIIRENLT